MLIPLFLRLNLLGRDNTKIFMSLVRRRRRPALRYRMLYADSYESSIFFLQLFLAVAMNRRPAWRGVPWLNPLSSPYTLSNHILDARVNVYHT